MADLVVITGPPGAGKSTVARILSGQFDRSALVAGDDYDGVVGPWYLESFAAATGLGALQYVLLLPPEASCVERVRAREGHTFSDVNATRHMYRQFAEAEIDARHLVNNTDTPEAAATSIMERLKDGTYVWTPDGHVGPAPGAPTSTFYPK